MTRASERPRMRRPATMMCGTGRNGCRRRGTGTPLHGTPRNDVLPETRCAWPPAPSNLKRSLRSSRPNARPDQTFPSKREIVSFPVSVLRTGGREPPTHNVSGRPTNPRAAIVDDDGKQGAQGRGFNGEKVTTRACKRDSGMSKDVERLELMRVEGKGARGLSSLNHFLAKDPVAGGMSSPPTDTLPAPLPILTFLPANIPSFRCAACTVEVALQDELVSRSFSGASGPAYLVRSTWVSSTGGGWDRGADGRWRVGSTRQSGRRSSSSS